MRAALFASAAALLATTACATVIGVDTVSYAGAGGGGGASASACVAAPIDDACGRTGVCPVRELDHAEKPADGLVLDGTFLYFTRDNGVWRVPLDGSRAAQLLASNEADAGAMATDGTYVYWSSRRTLRRCAIAGPCTAETAYTVDSEIDHAVAVGPGVLFVIGNTKLVRVDANNHTGEVVADMGFDPHGLTADGAYVYATGRGARTQLLRVSFDGRDRLPLAPFPRRDETITALAATCDALYAVSDKGSVLALDKASGEEKPKMTFANVSGGGQLAVDGTYLYVAVHWHDGIRRFRIDGGGDGSLMQTPINQIFDVVSDAHAVYWTNDNNSISKLV